MTAEAIGWAAALGLLGVILGSFVATLVVRWPAGRSVVHGRSACDGCGRTLRAAEMVPLLGFAWMRGRCATCGGTIDRAHPAIEALALAIGVAAGLVASGPGSAAAAVFGWMLLALGALDLAAFWLPDRLTLALALLGAGASVAGLGVEPVEAVIGGIGGYAGLRLVGWAYRRTRGREGLGGGDAKLLGAIGLWIGWRMLPAVLLCACLVGLGVVSWRRLTGRRVTGSDVLPLGTLLALAAYPARLAMIGWGG